MTIVKIAYSKTYPITNLGAWEKILLEAQLIAGEDVRQCLYDLKKQVENFHYESNKSAEKQLGVAAMQGTVERGMSLEEQIKTVTDPKVLESYRLLVKNNPDLEQTYLNKLKELSHV